MSAPNGWREPPEDCDEDDYTGQEIPEDEDPLVAEHESEAIAVKQYGDYGIALGGISGIKNEGEFIKVDKSDLMPVRP